MIKNPSPDPAYLAALADVEAKALALRLALNKLADAAPVASGPWYATTTAPEVARRLGAIGLVCDGNQAAIHGYTSALTTLLQQKFPAELAPFADGMAEGMAGAAMSCPCDACMFCTATLEAARQDRAAAGPARAVLRAHMVRTFREGMDVPETKRIVMARG